MLRGADASRDARTAAPVRPPGQRSFLSTLTHVPRGGTVLNGSEARVRGRRAAGGRRSLARSPGLVAQGERDRARSCRVQRARRSPACPDRGDPFTHVGQPAPGARISQVEAAAVVLHLEVNRILLLPEADTGGDPDACVFRHVLERLEAAEVDGGLDALGPAIGAVVPAVRSLVAHRLIVPVGGAPGQYVGEVRSAVDVGDERLARG